MKMRKFKVLMSVIALIIASFMLVSIVSAVEVADRQNIDYNRSATEDAINQGDIIGIDVVYIKINEDEVENGDEIRTQFKRDSELDIRIKLMANRNISNVEIIAMINGDDHNKISDTSEVFDVEEGTIYTKSLKLSLADIMEQDNYALRILIGDRYDAVKVYNYLLKIDTEKHFLQIKDVIFTPENEVKQGRALLGIVRIKNAGEKDEKDVKVSISIPTLGLSANDYIDEIEDEDIVSSEELYMRVPTCATPGTYPVNIIVEYDEGTRKVETQYSISVVEVEGACMTSSPAKPSEEKTIISVNTEMQDVSSESVASYPLIISNIGAEKKAYTISVDGVDDWAEASITPSNVVFVDPNGMKTVFVTLKALDDAAEGEHMFSVTIATEDKSEEIALKANVVDDGKGFTGLAKGLEIALIIVIILVVILGLIVAFNKLKSSDDEDEFEDDEEAKSYY